MLSVFVLCVVLTAQLCARIGRTDKNDEQRLLRFIENVQDVNQLGTILEAANFSSAIYWATADAIPRLLLLIQPADADRLTTHQRAVLRSDMFGRWLFDGGMRIRSGADYCLPMLSALEKIGDKRDLPDVELLLKSQHFTDEIRVAAERCALVIWERVAREEGKDFLLRADRKPYTIETLLRPTTENAGTPPQQLLRAATSDAHDPPV